MPGFAAGVSTTAPAPSPKSTQVPRSFQSRMREVARLLARRRDVPLPDPGSGANPFVARIDSLGKLVVGENLCREIAARARNPAMHRRNPPRLQRDALLLLASPRAVARCARA